MNKYLFKNIIYLIQFNKYFFWSEKATKYRKSSNPKVNTKVNDKDLRKRSLIHIKIPLHRYLFLKLSLKR